MSQFQVLDFVGTAPFERKVVIDRKAHTGAHVVAVKYWLFAKPASVAVSIPDLLDLAGCKRRPLALSSHSLSLMHL